MTLGIIGGSGLYGIEGLEITREVTLSTPCGEPSSAYALGTLDGRDVVFLARHGIPHRLPPHKVNYRANIWGFKSLGVERLIAVSAVGGIHRAMSPGSLVLLDQIIDMTQGARASTFFDGEEVVHVDFTFPYCSEMRTAIMEAALQRDLPLVDSGTYICVNGPRLETAREIAFFSSIGADVVGMTAMPEAALAREAELCLAGIAVVTNYAAGMVEKKLTTTEVVETMKGSLERIKALVREALVRIPPRRACSCGEALKDAKL
ncbi:MAG: S-methyl-5'-thioadenosine phosphorylase [Nitrospirota bacterium]